MGTSALPDPTASGRAHTGEADHSQEASSSPVLPELHIRPHPSGYVVTGYSTSRSFMRKDAAVKFCEALKFLEAIEHYVDDDPTGELADAIAHRDRDFRDEYLSGRWL